MHRVLAPFVGAAVLAACGGPSPTSAPPLIVAAPTPPPTTTTASSPSAPSSTAMPETPTPTIATSTAAASVRLDFPRVSAAPSLVITIRNAGDAPIPKVEFRSVACLAKEWLALSLTGPDGKQLPLAPCAAADETGRHQSLAPGRDLRVEVPLQKLFPTMKKGKHRVDANWTSAAGFDAQLSMSGFDLAVADALVDFSIAAGASRTLPGGAVLLFNGHSHKNVDAASAPGPLIVEGTFTEPGKKSDTFYASVFVERTRFFELGNAHVFELVEHVYGKSMHLKYYGRLP